MESMGLWMGKPIEDLPRETLLEIIGYLGRENRRRAAERKEWPSA